MSKQEGIEYLNCKETIRIGTRDSELAMRQTHHVQDELIRMHPDVSCTIASMKTLGDKIQDVALSKIGSKSLFTKELEEALARNCIHLVVHSLKDLPTSLPPGMVIGAILKREDPRDAVLLHPHYKGKTLSDLPKGAVLGSSSVRRVAQLRRHYPGLEFRSIRGNLNTRLRKLEEKEGESYAGLVLAAAGLHRMGWKSRVAQYLDASECLYAVGQGALAVECLSSDVRTLTLLRSLCDTDSLLAAVAERAFMAKLEGGCSAPVAVCSKVEDDTLNLQGGVWSLDGQKEIKYEMSVTFGDETDHSQCDCSTNGDFSDASDGRRNSSEDTNSTNEVHSAVTGNSSNGVAKKEDHNSDHPITAISINGNNNGVNGQCCQEFGVKHCDIRCGTACFAVTLGPVVTGNKSAKKNVKEANLILNSINSNGCKRSLPDRLTSQTFVKKLKLCHIHKPKTVSSLEVDRSVQYCGIVPPPYLAHKASVAYKLGCDLAQVLLDRGAGPILTHAKAQNSVMAPNTRPCAPTKTPW